MSLVADKYSENDPVPCSIDDLAVTEIKDELQKIGVKTRLKNRKTFRPFKEQTTKILLLLSASSCQEPIYR
jgi:hypothetical protein